MAPGAIGSPEQDVPLIDRMRAASESLVGVFGAVERLSDDDLVRFTAETEALGRMVDGLRARAAGEVVVRSASDRDRPLAAERGCRGARELLERVTGAAGPAIGARLRQDERTRERVSPTGLPLPSEHPAVAAALEAGLLGADAASLILQSAQTARKGAEPSAIREERLEAMEAHLVGIATGTASSDLDDARIPEALQNTLPSGIAPASPYAVLRTHADAWIEIITSDGVEPDAERVVRHRALTLTERPDGSFRLDGVLVPEAGALAQALLSAHTNPARRVRFAEAETEAEAETTGRPPQEPFDGTAPEDRRDEDPWSADEIVHDPRTATQKRHDALMAILQTASRSAETPLLGGAAPTLIVHVSADDLASEAGVAHLDGVGKGVPASIARRVGCTGNILRAVFGPQGQVLALSSTQRCFTATQRKAIVARDGGCIIPGCTIPAAWCEIHHVRDHAQGGPTTTGNGVLLCWWHHHHLDRSGWDIRMRDGVPYVSAPHWIDRFCRPRPAPTSRTRTRVRLRAALEARRT